MYWAALRAQVIATTIEMTHLGLVWGFGTTKNVVARAHGAEGNAQQRVKLTRPRKRQQTCGFCDLQNVTKGEREWEKEWELSLERVRERERAKLKRVQCQGESSSNATKVQSTVRQPELFGPLRKGAF